MNQSWTDDGRGKDRQSQVGSLFLFFYCSNTILDMLFATLQYANCKPDSSKFFFAVFQCNNFGKTLLIIVVRFGFCTPFFLTLTVFSHNRVIISGANYSSSTTFIPVWST